MRSLVLQAEDFKRAVATRATNAQVIDGLRSPAAASMIATQDQLSTMVRSKDSPAAFVTDTRGRIVAVYPFQPELIGKDFSFRDWFKGASRTGQPYVSEGYRSAASGHPLVVAIASPVLDRARTVGYVAVLWQLDSVRSVVDGARKDDGVNITVTDQRGQSLFAALIVDDRGQPRQATVSATTRQALAGRDVSTVEGGKLEAAGPVPGLGWTVTASLQASVALVPADTFRRSLAVTLGVALLLVVLFTALTVRVARRRAAERIAAEGERDRLRVSEDRFRRVFDEGLTGMILVSPDGDILRVNATVAMLLAREPSRLLGRPLVSCFDDADDQRRILGLIAAASGDLRAEMAMRDSSDRLLWGLVALTWISERDGQQVLLVQIEDVTARRDAEHRLTELTLHDELTGLPNRRLLLERCQQAFVLAKSGRADSTGVAALFVDLDGFKAVNDRAGHDTGDQLLVAIARDLETAMRPSDTVARVGGDEFVVLIEQANGLDHLRGVADRITAAVRRTVTTDGSSLTVSASVGIARVDFTTEPDMCPDQLLRRADAAMYRAKERGRDRHDVFDADLRDRTEARQALEQAMRDGLRHDRVGLVFQPVIEVDSNVVVGAEALMRLRDAAGRLLPTLPAVIAAEGAGLAEALGDRVLHLALDAASNWPAHMSIAVNVSARELTGKELRGRIEHALERHSFDPARLVLEITETSILTAGPSALAELEKLRQKGVRVAIDDFGTAYATLQNLTTLPVDALKVDASFTAGLPDQRTHTAIIHGIASMAYELDIPCIIEGVETQAQRAALQGMAVQAQGWLWGQPEGPDQIPCLKALPLPRAQPDARAHPLH